MHSGRRNLAARLDSREAVSKSCTPHAVRTLIEFHAAKMASYTPDTLVSKFHAIPRYGDGLKTVANTFNIDYEGDGRGYRE